MTSLNIVKIMTNEKMLMTFKIQGDLLTGKILPLTSRSSLPVSSPDGFYCGHLKLGCLIAKAISRSVSENMLSCGFSLWKGYQLNSSKRFRA